MKEADDAAQRAVPIVVEDIELAGAGVAIIGTGQVVTPPSLYFGSCGSLCDVFWWARTASIESNRRG
jgi:hypothetical protein